MVKLSTTAVIAIVRIAVEPTATPYSFARNRVPISHVIGVATLNVETESGNTKPVTGVGSSSARAPSTSAGSDASDELELIATACAGSTARVNQPRGIPPIMDATGYISSAHRTNA